MSKSISAKGRYNILPPVIFALPLFFVFSSLRLTVRLCSARRPLMATTCLVKLNRVDNAEVDLTQIISLVQISYSLSIIYTRTAMPCMLAATWASEISSTICFEIWTRMHAWIAYFCCHAYTHMELTSLVFFLSVLAPFPFSWSAEPPQKRSSSIAVDMVDKKKGGREREREDQRNEREKVTSGSEGKTIFCPFFHLKIENGKFILCGVLQTQLLFQNRLETKLTFTICIAQSHTFTVCHTQISLWTFLFKLC